MGSKRKPPPAGKGEGVKTKGPKTKAPAKPQARKTGTAKKPGKPGKAGARKPSRALLIALGAGALIVIAAAVVLISSGGSGGSNGVSPLVSGSKPVFFEPGPEELVGKARDDTLDEIVGMGIDRVRVAIFWNDVAPQEQPQGFKPSNPRDSGYDFSDYDSFMRAAAAHNLKILATVSGPGPAWTTLSGKPDSEPDPEQFGEFVSAVAKRYGGTFTPKGDSSPLPSPYLWSLWNEPNISSFLKPQFKNGKPYSPTLYRHLYLAGQEAIEAEDPGAKILIGDTAPTGSTDSVDPVPFAQGVLCQTDAAQDDPSCDSGEIDAVGWATHPYQGIGQAPFDPPVKKSFVTLAGIQSLVDVLDRASDEDTLPSDFPVYIDEYGIQSYPDFTAGVSFEAQAEYISISEYLAYAYPRVVSFAQYLMRDDPPDHVPGVSFGGFESGLRFFNGIRKPSLDAFPVPLVVRRQGPKVDIWGLIRPAEGETTAEIWVQDGGVQKKLESVETNSTGILQTTSDYQQGRLWQLRWTDPGGKTVKGPWTRSFSFPLPKGAEESALAG